MSILRLAFLYLTPALLIADHYTAFPTVSRSNTTSFLSASSGTASQAPFRASNPPSLVTISKDVHARDRARSMGVDVDFFEEDLTRRLSLNDVDEESKKSSVSRQVILLASLQALRSLADQL